ncbi:hypothetical protein ES707_16428 [subsurface metagenome]
MVFFDIGHTIRSQNTNNFLHRNFERLLRDQEIDKIVSVRQPNTVKLVHRDLTINTERANIPAGFFHIFHISIQAVDQVAIICAQSSRQLPVPAADMDYKSALDACGV